MRRAVFALALFSLPSIAAAGGIASVSCAPPPINPRQPLSFAAKVPTINLTFSTGTDAGAPGLFWMGLESPNHSSIYVLNDQYQWVRYQGGLYPPNQIYRAGLPGTITMSVPLPVGRHNRSTFAGYTLYAGEGELTPSAQNQVALRRQYLEENKQMMQANGSWNSTDENDDEYEWALIQKDMKDNGKWSELAIIPNLVCSSSSSSTSR